jgi:ferritin-like metal-binding protein YciE
METLQELLLEELKDLYSAEKQIVKALPKIIRGVKTPDLKAAITEHLEITKTQVTRLEEVFGHLDEKPKAKHCKGMEGLLAEGSEALEEQEAGPLRDLQLIGAAQRVEHYEVSAYGTARAIAEQLGLNEAVELLGQTLEEETQADEKLTEVAGSIYEEVEEEPVDEDEGDEEEGVSATGNGRMSSSRKRMPAKKGR